MHPRTVLQLQWSMKAGPGFCSLEIIILQHCKKIGSIVVLFSFSVHQMYFTACTVVAD